MKYMEDIVVAITSKKDRLKKCGNTVKSIINSYPDMRVSITVPEEDECVMKRLMSDGYFGSPSDSGRITVIYKNSPPSKYNRLIWTMLANPDSLIISASDSMIYHPGFFDGLLDMYHSYPESICRMSACDVRVSFNGKDYSSESVSPYELDHRHIIKLTYGPGTIYPPANKTGFSEQWQKFFSGNLIRENCSEDAYNGMIAESLGIKIRTVNKNTIVNDPRAEKAIREAYGRIFPRPVISQENADTINEDISIMTVSAEGNAIPAMAAISPIRIRFNVNSVHSGKNIDDKNQWMCELTGLYYMWKNWNAGIVGLEHYRRFFTEEGKSYSPHEYTLLDAFRIKEILNTHDFIVTCHQHAYGNPAYLYMTESGNTQKFSVWLDFLNETTPGFKQFCMDYLTRSGTLICCNMFIAKKTEADEYCEWLFANMENFFKQYPLNDMQARIMGYMAEFTFGAWLMFTGKRLYICNHIRFDKACINLDEVERTTIHRNIIRSK